MLHTLRFAFLLGTLFLPLFMAIVLASDSDTFWRDVLVGWLLLILASLLLKLLTLFKQKAGNAFTRWRKSRRKQATAAPAPDPATDHTASLPYLPTGFIHEVGELAFVGELISMGIGLFPAFCAGVLINWLLPGLKSVLDGRVLIALMSSSSIAWILFLEKRYAIKLTSPLFGLPLKWVLIPMFILFFFLGYQHT